MLLDLYDRGRFPPNRGVASLQDIAAEAVARRVEAGNSQMHQEAVNHIGTQDAILEARDRAFVDQARRMQVELDRQRFRLGIREALHPPRPGDMTAEGLRAHRNTARNMLSPEAIHHATDGRLHDADVLRFQFPTDVSDFQQVPANLPAGFRAFLRQKTGVETGYTHRDDLWWLFHDYHLPYEGFETLLGQLWREWSNGL